VKTFTPVLTGEGELYFIGNFFTDASCNICEIKESRTLVILSGLIEQIDPRSLCLLSKKLMSGIFLAV
jgi:hypothetical protein